MNPLEIRRVYSTDGSLKIKAPKAVKSGKKGNVAVDIDTKGLQAGTYVREIVVITNDYMNPIKSVKLNYTVE